MTTQITEGNRSDISTVYAYYTVPTERYGNGSLIMCDAWSVFNGYYELGKEREFIAEIEVKNPGKYSSFHIAWVDSN